MKYILLILPVIFFLGCNVDLNKKIDNNTTIEINTTISNIEVFTLAPVIKTIVTDSDNKLAKYNVQLAKYQFTGIIKYPIIVKSDTNTYIDIDFDNNKSAIDLKPSTYITSNGLKSFCNSVNIITSLYYTSNYKDNNISINDYKADIKNRFGIDICNEALSDENVSKVLYGIYNYSLENNITKLEDFDNEVSKINNFFDVELSKLDNNISKTKYYSFYNSLVKLDKGLVNRIDIINKPLVDGVLRDKISLINSNNNINVFDMQIYNSNIYIASGHDELAKTDLSFSGIKYSKASLLSFGNNMSIQEYNNQTCLFLANSKAGLKSFRIDGSNFTNEANITVYDVNGSEGNFTQTSINNSNSFISVGKSKRLLGISTSDKGYYLLNIKDRFKTCKPVGDINATKDFLIQEDSGTSISAQFRSDGTYLYVTHKDKGISGYKVDILDNKIIKASKKDFTLKDSLEAYNIKVIDNDNSLFVTTNKELLIYNIGSSSDNLQYVGSYKTQGAQKDYLAQIDSNNNLIFLTDGYNGIKILKLNNNFQPSLCGVEYFAPANEPTKLAKVSSVKYSGGFLYIGITSYGAVKIKVEDLLFRHCK